MGRRYTYSDNSKRFPESKSLNKRFFEFFYKGTDQLATMYKLGNAEYVVHVDDVPDEMVRAEHKVVNGVMSADRLAILDMEQLYTTPYEYWGHDIVDGSYTDVCNESVATDAYFALNPMINNRIKRCQRNIRGLSWCFVDIDYDTTQYRDMDPYNFYFTYIKPLFDEKIPKPTVVMFTGRGFHLYWKLCRNEDYIFNECESMKAKKRWQRINGLLNDTLADIGADVKISGDYARLVRIPGSVNSKSGETVTIIDMNEHCRYTLFDLDAFFNGKEASDKMYELFDQMVEVLGFGRDTMLTRTYVHSFITKNFKNFCRKIHGKATVDQIKTCKKLARKADIRCPKSFKSKFDAHLFIRRCSKIIAKNFDPTKPVPYYHGMSPIGLSLKRLAMIEDVIKCDNNRTGHRELTLFVARILKLQVTGGDKEAAVTYILDLNQRFSEPLSEKEAVCATKSAENYYGEDVTWFKISNKLFFDYLDVPDEERSVYLSRQKKQLTPEEEEERKARLRRQKLESYYRRRARKGLDTMEERQSKKRELIKDCIAKNMRIVVMVEKTNIARGTIRNLIIAMFGTPEMKKVKALMKENSTDEKSAREFLDSIDLVLKAKKEKEAEEEAAAKEAAASEAVKNDAQKNVQDELKSNYIKEILPASRVMECNQITANKIVKPDRHNEITAADNTVTNDCATDAPVTDSPVTDNTVDNDDSADNVTNEYARKNRNKLIHRMISVHDKEVMDNYLTKDVNTSAASKAQYKENIVSRDCVKQSIVDALFASGWASKRECC